MTESDAVQFRSSAVRSMVVAHLVLVVALVLVQLMIGALGGGLQVWQVIGSVGLMAVCALVGTGACLVLARGRPTWIRISSIGVEMVFRGGEPVLLAWSEIDVARVRRRDCSPCSRSSRRTCIWCGARCRAGTFRPCATPRAAPRSSSRWACCAGPAALRAVLARHARLRLGDPTGTPGHSNR
jgi:hypothetical protein